MTRDGCESQGWSDSAPYFFLTGAKGGPYHLSTILANWDDEYDRLSEDLSGILPLPFPLKQVKKGEYPIKMHRWSFDKSDKSDKSWNKHILTRIKKNKQVQLSFDLAIPSYSFPFSSQLSLFSTLPDLYKHITTINKRRDTEIDILRSKDQGPLPSIRHLIYHEPGKIVIIVEKQKDRDEMGIKIKDELDFKDDIDSFKDTTGFDVFSYSSSAFEIFSVSSLIDDKTFLNKKVGLPFSPSLCGKDKYAPGVPQRSIFPFIGIKPKESKSELRIDVLGIEFSSVELLPHALIQGEMYQCSVSLMPTDLKIDKPYNLKAVFGKNVSRLITPFNIRKNSKDRGFEGKTNQSWNIHYHSKKKLDVEDGQTKSGYRIRTWRIWIRNPSSLDAGRSTYQQMKEKMIRIFSNLHTLSTSESFKNLKYIPTEFKHHRGNWNNPNLPQNNLDDITRKLDAGFDELIEGLKSAQSTNPLLSPLGPPSDTISEYDAKYWLNLNRVRPEGSPFFFPKTFVPKEDWDNYDKASLETNTRAWWVKRAVRAHISEKDGE